LLKLMFLMKAQPLKIVPHPFGSVTTNVILAKIFKKHYFLT